MVCYIVTIMNKEQERSELHKTIWQIANQLRGSVDGFLFKEYVLGTLFYRFISESLVEYVNNWEHKTGNQHFDYTQIDDEQAKAVREQVIEEKGFFIPPSELFMNVTKRAKTNKKDLNVALSQVFRNIENSAKGQPSEDDIKGLFDDFDVNSKKLGATANERNDKLADLLDSIAQLPFEKYTNSTIDAFGDAYEYLIKMYASNAGKSGGEFFTPQEVSELLARITIVDKKSINKVYDPACGSGSLLLKFAKLLGEKNVRQGYFGQEINITTYNLARINMFLHGINYNKFDIAHGNTLINPKHWDEEPFDAIVSNPPYSIKWEGSDNPILINDPRYSPAGILAPKSKADLAFTMHMLSWLSPKGTAAIVSFPGVLYRGGAEQKIRKYLIENNYIDTIIQLPPDLFFGTGIATAIMVLKKSKSDNKILFIDASKEFVRSGNKNKLTTYEDDPENNNIKTILETYKKREEKTHFSALVSKDKIAENDYNIAVSTYVEPEDTREKIDIKELNTRIAKIVQKQSTLRTEIDKIVAELEGSKDKE